ncbi:hypothetical protein B0H13DRAFT_2303681 [Mycena leptocephala]|nr:hypothetical protein B0H13DRAFT_2303681 [Mycena leptocephala]
MAGSRVRRSKHAKYKISGLKNQSSRLASSPEAPARSPSPQSPDDCSDSNDLVDTDHDDDDNEADWEEIASEESQERLLGLIVKVQENLRDAGDDDGIPTRDAYKAN